MKYFKPDAEEREIIEAIRKGKITRVKNFEEEKKKAMEAAKNTFKKNKNINIRLTERTLVKLKIKAMEEGIPYQTLASSILHKYVNQ